MKWRDVVTSRLRDLKSTLVALVSFALLGCSPKVSSPLIPQESVGTTNTAGANNAPNSFTTPATSSSDPIASPTPVEFSAVNATPHYAPDSPEMKEKLESLMKHEPEKKSGDDPAFANKSDQHFY